MEGLDSKGVVNPIYSIEHSAHTDVGMRREENQDSFGIIVNDEFRFYIVADGMGGVKGGALASNLAVATVDEALSVFSRVGTNEISQAVSSANRAIFQKGIENKSLQGMGTTFVGLCFQDAQMIIVNVGDSRAYRVRGGHITQLTEDHTLVNELVKSGALAPDQAEGHPISHMLTRSLGPMEKVEVDCWFSQDTPCAGDKYLLCSDGLYGLVKDSEIEGHLLSMPLDEAVIALISLANSRGGTDNITIIALCLGDDYPPSLEKTGSVSDGEQALLNLVTEIDEYLQDDVIPEDKSVHATQPFNLLDGLNDFTNFIEDDIEKLSTNAVADEDGTREQTIPKSDLDDSTVELGSFIAAEANSPPTNESFEGYHDRPVDTPLAVGKVDSPHFDIESHATLAFTQLNVDEDTPSTPIVNPRREEIARDPIVSDRFDGNISASSDVSEPSSCCDFILVSSAPEVEEDFNADPFTEAPELDSPPAEIPQEPLVASANPTNKSSPFIVLIALLAVGVGGGLYFGKNQIRQALQMGADFLAETPAEKLALKQTGKASEAKPTTKNRDPLPEPHEVSKTVVIEEVSQSESESKPTSAAADSSKKPLELLDRRLQRLEARISLLRLDILQGDVLERAQQEQRENSSLVSRLEIDLKIKQDEVVEAEKMLRVWFRLRDKLSVNEHLDEDGVAALMLAVAAMAKDYAPEIATLYNAYSEVESGYQDALQEYSIEEAKSDRVAREELKQKRQDLRDDIREQIPELVDKHSKEAAERMAIASSEKDEVRARLKSAEEDAAFFDVLLGDNLAKRETVRKDLQKQYEVLSKERSVLVSQNQE